MAKKEKMLATKSGRKNVINCIIALIIAVVFLFPIYWILAMSFKTDAESFGKIVTYYPHEFTIDPWVKNLSDREFLNSLRNSAVIAVLSMVLSMVFGETEDLHADFSGYPDAARIFDADADVSDL